MNDFTKEELLRISDGLSWWRARDSDYSMELLNKIESMIDNYCEHRKSFECPECGIYKCEKCERATHNNR